MIAGMTYYEMAGYFLVYSFLGWCLEVIYQAVKRGKVINRGFLCGPVCPVYGFGVLTVFMLTRSHLAERLGLVSSCAAVAVLKRGPWKLLCDALGDRDGKIEK